MTAKVFIDGEAGTTGLQIRERLADRRDIELLTIATEKRKDAGERKRLLNAADVAILCLPDDAARESVAMIENETTRVIAPKPASAPSPPQLPETGADLETLRAPTGIAVVLLAAGAAVLAARRPWFGARPDIG